MTRHTYPAIAALLLVVGMVLGCGREASRTVEPSKEPVRAELATVQVTEQPQTVELRGTVEAGSSSAVAARVMATITSVRVEVGQAVRRGDLLATIDPQVTAGEEAQAQGAVSQAEAAEALAKRNLERYQALLEKQAASQLEVDVARADYERAHGAVEQARGALAAASSVAADTRVTAPFEGHVAQRLVDVGDLATPGRPLFMLESTAGRRLRVSVPESLMSEARLQIGTPIPVAIDSRDDLGRMRGVVVERTPGADPLSHSYVVKLKLPVADVATGSAGRAWLETGRRTRVLVPSRAVVRYGGLQYVVLRDGQGRTTSRVVTVGEDLGDGSVEILSGLEGGETALLGLISLPPAGRPVEAADVAGETAKRK